MSKTTKRVAAVVVLGVSLAGCGGDTERSPGDEAGQGGTTASSDGGTAGNTEPGTGGSAGASGSSPEGGATETVTHPSPSACADRGTEISVRMPVSRKAVRESDDRGARLPPEARETETVPSGPSTLCRERTASAASPLARNRGITRSATSGGRTATRRSAGVDR